MNPRRSCLERSARVDAVGFWGTFGGGFGKTELLASPVSRLAVPISRRASHVARLDFEVRGSRFEVRGSRFASRGAKHVSRLTYCRTLLSLCLLSASPPHRS
ncbi:hypothetical protein AKJ09_00912 [Labilithrix luteola]|uniref:Uncharacterized protein n=1 Tax=Labilithrix luteola TaxID=1391654 RepID=A0A0K1PL44_9BACT|nr:hypothetical protein AKJ09_00912 [Labilithrix luteola]